MSQLTLYSLDISPSSQRVLAALAYKEIDYKLVTIDITQKERPKDFIKIAPLGRIPVLAVDGQVIWESNVINQYLDEAYPEKPLFPKDPLKRAEARKWMRFSDENILDLEEHALHETDIDTKIELATSILDSLALLNQTLADRGPCFMGKELSLVDLALLPPLRDALFIAEILENKKWKGYKFIHRYIENFKTHPILKPIIFDAPPDEGMHGLWHSTLKEGFCLPTWQMKIED